MSHLTLLTTITAIHAMAVVSPGPDFVIAIRNSLQYSRKTGIYTAIGIGTGIMVHIIYCLAGLGIIISQSILLFNIIKFAGAAYLMYIGIQSFQNKKSKIDIKKISKKQDISAQQALKIGFLTNALNPKATLFFLGLFTLIITPQTPPQVLVAASSIMIINTMIWFTLVAIFFTNTRIRQIYENFQGIINKTIGGMLIGMALSIVVTKE